METQAKSIMSTELITIPPETRIEEALKILVNNKITGIPVVNPSGRLIGVLSEIDIIHQITKKKKLKPDDFNDQIAFTEKVQAIEESTQLSEILKLFTENQYRRLPVITKEGKLVGIITRRDIMRVLFYRARMGDA